MQGLLHLQATGRTLQQVGIELVTVHGDVLLVDALARQGGNVVRSLGQREQGDAHIAAGTGAQILDQHGLHRFQRVAAGLVEGVEIELERLGFDEVRAGGRHRDLADGDHGFAFGIEPRELVQGPDIAALERQLAAKTEVVAVQTAGHRLQQGRGVLADVGRLLAQAQPLQGAGAGVSILFAHLCDSNVEWAMAEAWAPLGVARRGVPAGDPRFTLSAHGFDGAIADFGSNCGEFRCRIKSCLP